VQFYENIKKYKKFSYFGCDVSNNEKHGGPRSHPIVFDFTQ